MVLHLHTLLSLTIAAIAEAILMRISAEQVPTLHRFAPRYLKLVTTSKLWLLMLISALVLFALLVMILLFLCWLPFHMLLLCLRVCWWGFTIYAAHKIGGVGKRRLYMDLPPLEKDVWWSWSVSFMIFYTNKLTKMGESNHPWRSPTVVLKNSPKGLFKKTALLEFSYTALTPLTSPSSVWKLLRTCDRPACQTLPTPSWKLWNRSRCLLLSVL